MGKNFKKSRLVKFEMGQVSTCPYKVLIKDRGDSVIILFATYS